MEVKGLALINWVPFQVGYLKRSFVSFFFPFFYQFHAQVNFGLLRNHLSLWQLHIQNLHFWIWYLHFLKHESFCECMYVLFRGGRGSRRVRYSSLKYRVRAIPEALTKPNSRPDSSAFKILKWTVQYRVHQDSWIKRQKTQLYRISLDLM